LKWTTGGQFYRPTDVGATVTVCAGERLANDHGRRPIVSNAVKCRTYAVSALPTTSADLADGRIICRAKFYFVRFPNRPRSTFIGLQIGSAWTLSDFFALTHYSNAKYKVWFSGHRKNLCPVGKKTCGIPLLPFRDNVVRADIFAFSPINV
jgi:hypothetical protein